MPGFLDLFHVTEHFLHYSCGISKIHIGDSGFLLK